MHFCAHLNIKVNALSAFVTPAGARTLICHVHQDALADNTYLNIKCHGDATLLHLTRF
jgi:hypothetical protein